MKWALKYFSSVFLIFIISCHSDSGREQEIARIPVDLPIERFDRQFAQASSEDIPYLKSRYPYLFPKQYSDSVWMAKLNDTIQQELLSEVQKTFGDFREEEEALHSLFQHITYYFPKYRVPKVITLTSEVQYDNRVVLSDSLLLLGLDNYLGKDHHFYRSISRYIAQGLDKAYLTSDVVSAFAKKLNRFPRNRTFLSRMIHYGKEIYLKDLLIPRASDAQKMNYIEEEITWAEENEEQIWRYFIEQELLYSTDSELDRRFLDPAPFSKIQ
ncbi:MAG: gliding motility lipoprotein GldB [Croceivirga sp.]